MSSTSRPGVTGRACAALLGALAMFASGAGAAGREAWPGVARFSTFENDSHFDTDRYYTNGLQFSLKGNTDTRSPFATAQLLSMQANFGQLMHAQSDIAMFQEDPSVKRRNFVAGLMLGLRLDFPDSRSASHGPWFVQFKITRHSPEFRSSIPVPRRTFAAVTVGTDF